MLINYKLRHQFKELYAQGLSYTVICQQLKMDSYMLADALLNIGKAPQEQRMQAIERMNRRGKHGK